MSAIDQVRRDFPGVHEDEARVYADAVTLYGEAQENLAKNGAVTGHPKTGAPMVNPYLAIRESCSRTILQFHRKWAVKGGGGRMQTVEPLTIDAPAAGGDLKGLLQ